MLAARGLADSGDAGMDVRTNRRSLMIGSALAALTGLGVCRAPIVEAAAGDDPLPSWNPGPVKDSIIAFVTAVTDPTSPRFVPVAERLAAFDIDGTLWVERPTYVDLAFAEARGRARMELDPELAQIEPWKSLAEMDEGMRTSLPEEAVTGLVVDAFRGESPDTFQFFAREWLNTAMNPALNRRSLDLSYQPMQELLSYLRANEFDLAVASAGDIEFLRVYVEQLFGIPKEFTIGTQVDLDVRTVGNSVSLVRGGEIAMGIWGDNKPIAIRLHTGRRPIFAFGNADGDLPMLRNAMLNGQGMAYFIDHDDPEREFLDKREGKTSNEGLRDYGITVVSMKDDWATVFSDEPGPDLFATD